MKKKGFTLIELLAIIAIIAIIAVITVPQILNVIGDSKKDAINDSAFGYKNAVHQFYLTESADDSEFDMDGDFSIEDGVISNGAESFNIGISGQAPDSGEVTILNGDVTSGCITYGDYSVIIENGNVTDTIDGGCYNYSYFTLDSEAHDSGDPMSTDGFYFYSDYWGLVSANEVDLYSYGIYGYNTSKSFTPNSSWKYYIKEIEVRGKPVSGLFYDDDFAYALFLNNKKCEQLIVDKSLEENSNCRVLGNYKKYEVCGVVEGDTFCLKPEGNYIDYNIDVLHDLVDDHDSCSIITDTASALSVSCGDYYYGFAIENSGSILLFAAEGDVENSNNCVAGFSTEYAGFQVGCGFLID